MNLHHAPAGNAQINTTRVFRATTPHDDLRDHALGIDYQTDASARWTRLPAPGSREAAQSDEILAEASARQSAASPVPVAVPDVWYARQRDRARRLRGRRSWTRSRGRQGRRIRGPAAALEGAWSRPFGGGGGLRGRSRSSRSPAHGAALCVEVTLARGVRQW